MQYKGKRHKEKFNGYGKKIFMKEGKPNILHIILGAIVFIILAIVVWKVALLVLAILIALWIVKKL